MLPRLQCGCVTPNITTWLNDDHKKFQKCTNCNFESSWDQIWINHWGLRKLKKKVPLPLDDTITPTTVLDPN